MAQRRQFMDSKKKEKIVADYILTESVTAAAKANGVAWATAKRAIDEAEGLEARLRQERAQTAESIAEYMNSKREIICSILDKGLTALNSAEKMDAATPSQITTAMRQLIDMYGLVAERDKEQGERVTVVIDV